MNKRKFESCRARAHVRTRVGEYCTRKNDVTAVESSRGYEQQEEGSRSLRRATAVHVVRVRGRGKMGMKTE